MTKIYYESDEGAHMPHWVSVKGVTNPDGSPCIISMSEYAFTRFGFTIGQEITEDQAIDVLVAATGRDVGKMMEGFAIAAEKREQGTLNGVIIVERDETEN